MDHHRTAVQPSPLFAWLVVAALSLMIPGMGVQAGLAQTTPSPAEVDRASEGETFRLVARVLPGEWAELVAVVATPGAEDGAAADPTELARGELQEGPALVEALRRGGYVVYFRHAATDFSQTDQDRQDLSNCATQRNLDEQGRADARAIGEGFRALGIPVGAVLSSEYCRTRETAELAFGRVTLTRDLTSRASTGSEAERAERIEALRRLLATPPEPGTNTVLVGHQFNLQDATGISIAEGEAAIFLPLGDPATPVGSPAAGG